MKAELDEALVRDFPLLYADRHGNPKETCMCWGFACGDGWEPLIRRLSEKLEPLIAAMPAICRCGCVPHDGQCPTVRHWLKNDYPCPCNKYQEYSVRAAQVKEKFATLRFYMDHCTEEMNEAINEASRESARTCEECGAPGTLRSGGWLVTLCDGCAKARTRR